MACRILTNCLLAMTFRLLWKELLFIAKVNLIQAINIKPPAHRVSTKAYKKKGICIVSGRMI
jgi:hypothetical protein